jgi:hypothetical protein
MCEFYIWALQCLAWPISLSYPEQVPTFDARRLAPILVVKSFGGPEALYDWVIASTNEISGAVLLSRDGVGHSSYLLK